MGAGVLNPLPPPFGVSTALLGPFRPICGDLIHLVVDREPLPGSPRQRTPPEFLCLAVQTLGAQVHHPPGPVCPTGLKRQDRYPPLLSPTTVT